MHKILFLFDSTYGNAFFKGFAEELVKQGNQVLFVNMHKAKLREIKKQIQDFQATILFSFNLFDFENFKKILPQKKILFDIDTPENIINKKFFIREYNSNKEMHYVSIQSNYKYMLQKILPEITDYSRCHYMPVATSFCNIKSNKVRNIFFCSTNWDINLIETLPNLNKKELVKYYAALREDYFANEKLYFKKESNVNSTLKWNIAGLERVNNLSMLSDLGLEIYGNKWDKLFYNLDVMSCLKYKKILNLQECEKYYNESKISINFSHLQAKKAFSFRVMDIMATDSCLLMEDKEDWHNLFDKYLSQKTIDSVIYKDKYDMREKAKKLLTDDELRKYCVKELNYAIEQNGRWKYRIKNLEEILNVTLRNPTMSGAFMEISIKKKKVIKKFQFKKRYKLFIYSICLAFAQVPILDLLQRKETRKKLRQKINKYWR